MTISHRVQRALQAAPLACAILLPTRAAAAEFDLPPQPLAATLRQLAIQTNTQIAYSPEIVRGRPAPAIRGALAVDEAVALALQGTGLSFRRLATGSIVISRIRAPAADPLDEIVVTATRRPEAASRTPVSVAAFSQSVLTRRGVQDIGSLAATVPTLSFRRGASGDSTISIRGINSTIGAATVGVYLDDVPLQRRLANGVTSGNGNAYPQLFDLERVEVLRGPQGTLFGSSSLGGTLRYITRAPSLVSYSSEAQVDASLTEGGDPGYTAGVAVGGPILRERLGFRASAWTRRGGGYIDHVSIYDGQRFGENTNGARDHQLRLALEWAATADVRIAAALHASVERVGDLDIFWEKIPHFRVQDAVFRNGPDFLAPGLGALFPDFPDRTFDGYEEGPYEQFGPFKTPVGYYPTASDARLQTSPRTTRLLAPSLTVGVELGAVSLRSITSYVEDVNKGHVSSGGFGLRTAVQPRSFLGACGQGSPKLDYAAGCAPLTFPGFPQKTSIFKYRNERRSLVQELRISSPEEAGRLTWVAGLFLSGSTLRVKSDEYSNEEELTLRMRGVEQRFLLGNYSVGGDIADRSIRIIEKEAALYGELNYLLTGSLRAILGTRVTRTSLRYLQVTQGVVFPRPLGFTPTAQQPFSPDPRQTTRGAVAETPLTPRFGLAYQPSSATLVYATAAKGFRVGGVNTPVNAAQCAAAIASNGGPPPLTYGSDAVWSYELGVKTRPREWYRVDASAFYIDWRRPQVGRQFSCGYNYVANAGAAVSRGVELEAQVRAGHRITLSAAVGYMGAYHRRSIAVAGSTAATVLRGDPLGSPPWHASFGAQYDFIAGNTRSYVRTDYRYTSRYLRGAGGPTTVGYDPIVARGEAAMTASVRAGLFLGPFEASLSIENLTNSRDRLYVAHTVNSALITGTTFRPRQYSFRLLHRR